MSVTQIPPQAYVQYYYFTLQMCVESGGYSFSEHQGTNKLRKAYFAPAFLPLVAAELSGRQVIPVLPQVTHTELCGEPINSAWK